MEGGETDAVRIANFSCRQDSPEAFRLLRPSISRISPSTWLTFCAGAALADPPLSRAWEFAGTEVRARLDNPKRDPFWRFGDGNGNGQIDDNEDFGQIVPLNELLTPTEPVSQPPAPSIRDNTGGGAYDDDEPIGGNSVSYGTLPTLSIRFDTRVTPWYSSWQSVHVSQGVRFTSTDEALGDTIDQELQVDGGVRFVGLPSTHSTLATGGILGEFRSQSAMTSQSLGPHLGASWNARRGRWRAEASGMTMLGYRLTQLDEQALLFEDSIPVAVHHPTCSPPNCPAVDEPTAFRPSARQPHG